MRSIVILAHPNLEQSRVNKAWKQQLLQSPQVTVHDLYANYPNDLIDVHKEQQLLASHQRIIFQFPFYWYSSPSLLKKWVDEVYTYGFAYGSEGNVLRGKEFGLALSIGRAQQSYRPDGESLYTIEQLILPFKATILLTGMIYIPPFLVYRAPDLSEDELQQSANDYLRYVTQPSGSHE
jgi:glutathione-regulated potassium-efflux system ancillary protein KefG